MIDGTFVLGCALLGFGLIWYTALLIIGYAD